MIQCFDCQTSEKSSLCLNCFLKGEHENHRFRVVEYGNGFCDCGNPSALKEEGFCSRHSGFSSIDELLDEDVSMELKLCFGRLLSSLIYFARIYSYDNSGSDTQKDLIFLLDRFFTNCYNLSKKSSLFFYCFLICICDTELIQDLLPEDVILQILNKKNAQFEKYALVFTQNVRDLTFLKDSKKEGKLNISN